jgi:hypothetical protein
VDLKWSLEVGFLWTGLKVNVKSTLGLMRIAVNILINTLAAWAGALFKKLMDMLESVFMSWVGNADVFTLVGEQETKAVPFENSPILEFTLEQKPAGSKANSVSEGPCKVDSSGCVVSPNFPANYGNSQSCKFELNGKIKAEGSSIETEAGYDFLTINGVKLAGSGPLPIGSQANGVQTWEADSSEAAKGWRVCTDDTPMTLSNSVSEGLCTVDSSGCVLSPNFPSNYGPAQTCKFVLHGTILAEGSSMDTEQGWDWLTINGARLSGTGPLPIDSKATGVQEFASDGDVQRKGFKICTSATAPATPPSNKVNEGPCKVDSSGCVTSPNFPKNYGDSQICKFELHGKILTTGSSMDTEIGYDFLTINGKKISGKGPLPIGSEATGVQTWASDSAVAMPGWRLCTSAPAPDLPANTVGKGPCRVDDAGCVTSPNFPQNYGPSQICEFQLHGKIAATGSSIQTEGGYDWLTLNGKQLSGNGPLPIGSQVSGVQTWAADGDVNAKGWRICTEKPGPADTLSSNSVSEGRCRVDPAGCVTSPNFPAKYGPSQSCQFALHGTLLAAGTSIDTEGGYDWLTLNGNKLSGNGPLPIGSVMTGVQTWAADGDMQKTGWKLCTTAPAPPPPPPIQNSLWSGPCVKDQAGCITSPNFPKPYGDNEVCKFVLQGYISSSGTSFKSEAGYDFLTINGQKFSGVGSDHPGFPPTSQMTGQQIWTSDGAEVTDGWRLCTSWTFPGASRLDLESDAVHVDAAKPFAISFNSWSSIAALCVSFSLLVLFVRTVRLGRGGWMSYLELHNGETNDHELVQQDETKA